MMSGLGMLLPLLLLIGLMVLIVWAIEDRGVLDRGSREGEGPHVQGGSAEEILKERFARGEISEEEYKERHRILREEAPAARR